MDQKVNTDSGALELAAYGVINPILTGICDFVKVGSRNPLENPDASVYCHAPVPIYDLEAIGRTVFRVEIFAKDISGFKDVTTLSAISAPVKSALDKVSVGGKYLFNFTGEMSGSDGNGFHYIFLNFSVILS